MPVFSDGFESGNFSGAVGGFWYNTVRVTVSTENPRTGRYSLRAAYGPDPAGVDSWKEIRGNFEPNDAQEIWLEWYQFIPTNYAHRNDTGPDNNKFWIVGYDDNLHGGWPGDPGGWTVRMELNPTKDSGNISESRLVYGNETSGNSSPTASSTGPRVSQASGIISDSDLGTWVQYRLHLKLSTTIAASDGDMHFMKNGETILTNLGYPWGGTSFTNPANSFELLGWANSGFTRETVMFVDDVKVYVSDPGW